MNIGVQSSLGTWTNIGQRWFALSVVSSVSLGFRARATHSRAGISGYLVHARYNRWIYNIPGIYSIILLCVFKCMSSATETQAMRCQESRAVQSIIHWFELSIEGPRKKKKRKKRKFPRLAKAFLLRVAESNRNFYIFLHEVPPAATPPRELQWEPRREIEWFEQSCPDLSNCLLYTSDAADE